MTYAIRNLTLAEVPTAVDGDTIAAPALLPEDGADWPRPIAQVLLSDSRAEALSTAGVAAGFGEPPAPARNDGRTGREVSGFGGGRDPINHAARIKDWEASGSPCGLLALSLVAQAQRHGMRAAIETACL